MRNEVKSLVKLCSQILPILEPIYEFGSFQVPKQEFYADLRSFFPGKKYIGTDIREGPGVDIILDLHDIDLPSESVGTILILDTLEHVEYVRKAIKELYRILKPNGIIIMSSVMKFRIHNFPYDYWRFTPEGFKSLLKSFKFIIVESLGIEKFPHTIIGIGFKETISEDLTFKLKNKVKQWKEEENKEFNSFKNRLSRNFFQFIPPIIFRIYKKLFRKKQRSRY